MEEKYTSIELAKALDIYDQRWRRWSRWFLGPDEGAGRGQGRTRTYTYRQAFKVWICGYLLERRNLPKDEAKIFGAKLFKWFENNGFLDQSPKPEVKFWKIDLRKGTSVANGKVQYYGKVEAILESEVVGKTKTGIPISVLKLYHENIPSKIEVGTFFEDGFGTIYPQVVMAEFKQKLTSII